MPQVGLASHGMSKQDLCTKATCTFVAMSSLHKRHTDKGHLSLAFQLCLNWTAKTCVKTFAMSGGLLAVGIETGADPISDPGRADDMHREF